MTAITRWTPSSDLIRTSLDRMLNHAFNEFVSPLETENMANSRFLPAVDICETPESLRLFVELPGLKKEDVHITLENNVLTLSGERKFEKDAKQENYHRVERTYGLFTRSFTLPANVKTDKVEASFQDGVLTVTLPKADEAKPRRIAIR